MKNEVLGHKLQTGYRWTYAFLLSQKKFFYGNAVQSKIFNKGELSTAIKYLLSSFYCPDKNNR